MIAVRWRKVFRDLWINRTRTLLIVLTIAVGVFAVGTISATEIFLQEQLSARYAEIDPAHVVFTTSPYDAGLVHSIEAIPGVAAAEARRNLPVRLLEDAATGAWRDFSVFAIPDYDDMQVYKIWHKTGEWPPSRGTLLMERGSMAYLNLQEGQQVTIKTPEGKQRTLRISGTAHDLYHMPAFLEGTVYGYISEDTLRWLGEDVLYNELYVRLTGDATDAATLRRMTDTITDHLEGEALTVFVTYRPKAGSYPMDYIANTVLLLLTMLGGLILAIGGFLIVNAISALVAQQTRQIGIIKAIGGRTNQVIGIYLGMVLVLGLLGALLAVPLSVVGTRALVAFVAGMLNYDIDVSRFPAVVIAMELLVGTLLPGVAALVPILGGARKPPAEALNEYGRSRVWGGVMVVDGLLRRLPRLSRPDLLALRNPFRRRSRLVFSLIMLSLAGGSFITVVNLRSSTLQTVDNMLSFWQYDFWVDLDRPYLVERLQKVAARVPGIDQVEGWSFEMTRRVRPDGSESNPIFLFGLPPETTLAKASIVQGRWLNASDTNAVVVGNGLLNVEPGMAVGKDVVFKVNGKERTFRVVGTMEMMGNQTVGYLVYMPYATFSHLAQAENRADMVIVRTQAADRDQNLVIGSSLEKAFDDAGIEVSSVLQTDNERLEISSAFNILVALLMVMVVLLSFVGGLGLMGTMSLNVIERAREIGVIRAFGGSDRSVFRIVVLEGVATGTASWIFSVLLAVPLTRVFCDTIGNSFLNMSLAYRFSIGGVLLWLAVVVLLAALSSLVPARSAVRATVREVLSYE